MNRVSSALICLALTPATGAIAQQLVTELNSAPAWQFTQVPRLLQCDGQRVFGSFQSPYGEQGLFVSDGTAAGSRVQA